MNGWQIPQFVMPKIDIFTIFFFTFIMGVCSYFLLIFSDFIVLRTENLLLLHTTDDHMITMRVAENWARFRQPFFNEGEPVAANTSLFWPIILGSSIFAFGHTGAVAVNIVLSIFLSAATVFIATLFVHGKILKITLALFLTLSPTFLAYGGSGWEHIPQMSFVTLAFYLVWRDSTDRLCISNTAMIILSLSFIFRPDSAPLIVVFGIYWLVHKRNYAKWQTYLVAVMLLLLPIAYLSIMYNFYGSFAPNTAHLKNNGFYRNLVLGAAYIINPVESGFVPAIAIFLIIFGRASTFAKFVAICSVTQIVYVLFAGGDVFANGRFLMILLPTVTATMLTIVQGWNTFGDHDERAMIIPMALASLLMLVHAPHLARSLILGQNSDTALVEQLRLAQSIRENVPPSAGSIGLHWLGVGYHLPEFHVVDFLGKAEPYIARTEIRSGPVGHNRWDYDYAFDAYDIAIIPMRDDVVAHVMASDFRLEMRPFVFWQVAALRALDDGNYTYLPASMFGNEQFGAFVRNDILPQFGEQG